MDFNYHTMLPAGDIPEVTPEAMCEAMTSRLKSGWRLLCLAAVKAEAFGGAQGKCLLSLLIHDESATCHVLRTAPLTEYDSFTQTCPQAHMFEREIYEQDGIMPKGHPWLKPVRFVTPASGAPRPLPGDTNYFRVDGPPVHEVAVGPIHAGVIEPGHFRFQCYGEGVMYLEIGLGFQHRGVDKILSQKPVSQWLPIIECVAGDVSIANATAHSLLLEKLTAQPCPERGAALRAISLELERLACHTGDLGAMGGDVGFLPTSQWNGRIRGDFLNLTALLCGNRFGRGMVCPGGTAYDVDAKRCSTLLERLDTTHRDVRGAVDLMLQSQSVLDRFDTTGKVSVATARQLGMVGVAGRACGLKQDARVYLRDHEFFPAPCEIRLRKNGDVLSRAWVRSEEVDDSVYIIHYLVDKIPHYLPPSCDGLPRVPKAGLFGVTCVESWRGAVTHVGISGEEDSMRFYKMIDPSFHNWTGLAMALRNGEISDFPLCNKSFNLSYCGHDL